MATNNPLLGLTTLVNQQLGVIRTFTGLVNQLITPIKGAAGGGGTGAGQKGPIGLFAARLNKFAAAVGLANLAVGTMIAAVSAVPLAIIGMVSAAKQFVAAISPATVRQYETQQRNLIATIGHGLVPIITYATQALRDWAGILLPTVRRLRPALERFSQAVSGVVVGLVRIFGHWVDGAIKIQTVFWSALQSVADTIGGIVEVFASIYDVIVQFSDGNQDAIDAADSLAYALRKLVVTVTVANARILTLLGGGDAVRRFRESIEGTIAARKNPATGLVAAPTESGVGSIEDVLRRMNERAFSATAGGRAGRSSTDILEEIAATLKEAEGRDLKTIIVEAIREAGNRYATSEAPGDVSVKGFAQRAASSAKYGTAGALLSLGAYLFTGN